MQKLPLRAYWDLLAQYIRPQKGRFFLLSFLLLGSIGLQLINPKIIGGFIDAALAGAPARRISRGRDCFSSELHCSNRSSW